LAKEKKKETSAVNIPPATTVGGGIINYEISDRENCAKALANSQDHRDVICSCYRSDVKFVAAAAAAAVACR